MSKIPYEFTPIPNYFRDNGWFKDLKCLMFVTWAFSRCSTTSRKFFFLYKEVQLDPFEFIFGRSICSDETGLTHREIRTQLLHLEMSGTLKKSTSKSTSKYSVFKWSTDAFNKNEDQQKGQRPTSRRPAGDHNQEEKKIEVKEKAAVSAPAFIFSEKELALHEEFIQRVKVSKIPVSESTLRKTIQKFGFEIVYKKMSEFVKEKRSSLEDKSAVFYSICREAVSQHNITYIIRRWKYCLIDCQLRIG